MPASASARTVKQVMDWYEANELRDYAPAALKERRRQRGLFCDQYGGLTMEEAQPYHLQQFLKSQGQKANYTRRRVKAAICRPFNAAAAARFIDFNPFSPLKLPRGKRGRDWTDAEYKAILRASHTYFRRFIVFIRYSGMRPGELRLLTWDEVLEEMICIAEHKTSWATDEPRRIPFNRVIVRLLTLLRRDRCHDRYVFVNGFGRPWSCQALTKHLRMIRARVGLPKEVKIKGGRHYFATRALMKGVDLFSLMEILGHKDIRTTQEYVHMAQQSGWLSQAMNRAVGLG
jgi:integrase